MQVVLKNAFLNSSGLPPGQTNTFLPKPLPVSVQAEFYGEGIDPKYMGGAVDDGTAEAARWEQYQNELMTGFPEPPLEEVIVTPPESQGAGINRRAFYVCNDVGEKWYLLPDVNPQQINVSRNIRWFLSGNLDKQVGPPALHYRKSCKYIITHFPIRIGEYLNARQKNWISVKKNEYAVTLIFG